jgi:hypothetical protein
MKTMKAFSNRYAGLDSNGAPPEYQRRVATPSRSVVPCRSLPTLLLDYTTSQKIVHFILTAVETSNLPPVLSLLGRISAEP